MDSSQKGHFCHQCGQEFSSRQLQKHHCQLNEVKWVFHPKIFVTFNCKPLILQFSCDNCSASFKSKQGLQKHKERLHLGVRYQCNKCDKQFNDDKNLRRHHLVHEDTEGHPCDLCQKTFQRKDVLKKHRRTCGIIKEKAAEKSKTTNSYACDICQQLFVRATRLLSTCTPA